MRQHPRLMVTAGTSGGHEHMLTHVSVTRQWSRDVTNTNKPITYDDNRLARTIAARAFDAAGVPVEERHNLYDDAIQEAQLGLLRGEQAAEKRGDVLNSTGYAVVAGHREVLSWIYEFLREDNTKRRDAWRQIGRVVDLEVDDHFGGGLSPEDILIAREDAAERIHSLEEFGTFLYQLFLSRRKRGGTRSKLAAARDANVVLLSLQGYNAHAIAHELNFSSAHDAQVYLRRARAVIDKEIQNVQVSNDSGL